MPSIRWWRNLGFADHKMPSQSWQFHGNIRIAALHVINVFADPVKHARCMVDNRGVRSIFRRIMNIVSTVPCDGPTDMQGECEGASHYVLPGDRTRGLLLVCDHARNTLPEKYGSLGLPASEFERHIAYDIGVEAVVNGLSARLGLPAVLSCFSRRWLQSVPSLRCAVVGLAVRV